MKLAINILGVLAKIMLNAFEIVASVPGKKTAIWYATIAIKLIINPK